MTVIAHVTELKKKHAALAEQIELTERRPSFDHTKISALKREKLRLKEAIKHYRDQI